jgi:thioesterase domain-containing protein
VDRKNLPPPVVAPEADRIPVEPGTPTEKALAEIWCAILGVKRIGIHDDFFALGGHSLLAARLFAQIDQRMHVRLPIITVFESPTIKQLALAMDQQGSHLHRSGLLPIQPDGDDAPLFLVHGAGGDVLWGYANLARHMKRDRPIYGIQSPDGEEVSTLEEMAQRYLERIRAVQPDGPYQLGGYCFGGNVAQEMARQLEEQGESVALLALLDCAPSNCGYESIQWRARLPFDFTRNLFYWLEDFSRLKPGERRSLVLRKLRTLPRKLWGRLSGRRAKDQCVLEEVIDVTHVSERELQLWKHHLWLLARHVSKAYGGAVTLFRTRGHPLISSFAQDFGWGDLSARITVKRIPGSHEGIFMEPHVRFLARELENSFPVTHATPAESFPENQP